jgi:hypothetical protein
VIALARYVNVRGFLDCDYSDLDEMRNIVARYRGKGAEFHLDDSIVDLYLAGWLFQEKEINWVAHAFFGASMKEAGADLVFDQVSRIAGALPETEGLFFVDDEEGEISRRWHVADGRVSVRQGPALETRTEEHGE